MNLRRLAVLAGPFLWMMVLFLVPFLIVAIISLAQPRIGIPPYEPLLNRDGSLNITWDNFSLLFEDDLYVQAYWQSMGIAGLCALACLLIGYPMALAIARSRPQIRPVLLMLVILPFWTSFLIRVYAWMGILKEEGLLNGVLMGLGLISHPLVILNTNVAVYIGIVYSYLPFMILPLYATLERLDGSLLEAAADLGAKPWTAFLTVTLPLSWPGILAGWMLVFIPVTGEYVIPDLLGGSDTNMLGKALWDVFAINRDWPTAAALAVVLLGALAVPVGLLHRLQHKIEAEGGV